MRPRSSRGRRVNPPGRICPAIPHRDEDGARLHPGPAASPSCAATCACGLVPAGKCKVLEPPELRGEAGAVRFSHAAGWRWKPLGSHPGNPWKRRALRSGLDTAPRTMLSQRRHRLSAPATASPGTRSPTARNQDPAEAKRGRGFFFQCVFSRREAKHQIFISSNRCSDPSGRQLRAATSSEMR